MTDMDKLKQYRAHLLSANMPAELRNKELANVDAMIQQLEQGKIDSAYEMYSDPNSSYYQAYQKNLSKTVSENTPTINSLLGLSMAMGGDYSSSHVIANEKMKQLNKNNQEFINQSTDKFYLNGMDKANSLLELDVQNNQYYSGLAQRQAESDAQIQQQNNDRNASFWNNIITLGGGMLINKTGNNTGTNGYSNSPYSTSTWSPNDTSISSWWKRGGNN